VQSLKQYKIKKIMKTALQIVLSIAVLLLGFFIWESIQKPIRFQKEYDLRKGKVVDRLIQIRDAQIAYKTVNNQYTASFDTLIDFIKNGELPLVKMEGALTDSMIAAGINETKALALGYIKRDTIKISVMDSLARNKYIPDSICFIPLTNGKKFELGHNVITTASGVKVQVFEAKVPNEIFLNGMGKQDIINLNQIAKKLERYPGLKVGSLEEANNNAGNWE